LIGWEGNCEGVAAAVGVASNTQNAEASEKQLSGVKIYISLSENGTKTKRKQHKKLPRKQKKLENKLRPGVEELRTNQKPNPLLQDFQPK